MNSTNIQKETFSIDKKMRQELHSHSSCILWFTGLSGSGKSTLAREVESALFSRKISTYILDGDNMRFGLNKDLGFSKEDREENIRRIGEVSKLFVDSGTIILSAFISPYQIDRNQVRELVNENEFIEIFVNCPLEVCEQRDSKGLYQKARSGEIKGFTGIDDPYEKPTNPEIEVNTSTSSIQECVDEIVEYLTANNIIQK